MSDPSHLPELALIAKKIETLVRDADRNILEAAKLLAETKARFDRFEIRGACGWEHWSQAAFTLGRTRINELLRIGRAECPAAELELVRELHRARQNRYNTAIREARACPPPIREEVDPTIAPERQRLVDFALSAPLRRVQMVLAVADRLPPRLITASFPELIPQETPAVTQRPDLLSSAAHVVVHDAPRERPP